MAQFFVTLVKRRAYPMGEFIEIGSGTIPFELLSGLFCAIALGIFALLQPASDDDDSNGGGGGGLMQPIS